MWTANWSNDNKYIAIGGVDKKIRIFSGESFELLKTFESSTAIQRMSWHPHSNVLAIAATGGGSKLIDVDKDSIFYMKGANANGTRAIAWNYNGDLLANADYEGEITIWTKNGDHLRTIKKDNTVSNTAVDWHPFRNELIALSDSVRFYDSQGRLLKQFSHRNEKVLMLCVKWHKKGDFFVIGDYGNNDEDFEPLLQFWGANGKLIKEIKNSKAEYRNVSWTKDGKKLATASDALRIWTKDGVLIGEGLSEDFLWGVDWSPDGKYIVTSGTDGHTKIWDDKAKLIKQLVY